VENFDDFFSEKNVLSLDIRNLFWYNKRDDKTFA